MKNILKNTIVAGLLISATALPNMLHAQNNALVSLSGSLAGNAGGSDFTGFPYNSTYNCLLANQGPTTIPANVLRIHLIVPPAFEFVSPYVGLPSGWTYEIENAQSAFLVNMTDPLETIGIADPANPTGFVEFSVPIRTIASTPQVTFIWNVERTVNAGFMNWSVPFQNPGNAGYGYTTVGTTPLSISFRNFTANADAGCQVKLSWNVSSERNTEKYVVERGTNGTAFTAIAEVKKLNNEDENAYTFVDQKPLNAHNFYRIRQVGTDMKAGVTKVEQVKMNCLEDRIAIYPNPATDVVYVKGITDKGKIRIYNLVGQLVIEKDVENTQEAVSLASLVQGAYQLQVFAGDKSVFHTKLVKK